VTSIVRLETILITKVGGGQAQLHTLGTGKVGRDHLLTSWGRAYGTGRRHGRQKQNIYELCGAAFKHATCDSCATSSATSPRCLEEEHGRRQELNKYYCLSMSVPCRPFRAVRLLSIQRGNRKPPLKSNRDPARERMNRHHTNAIRYQAGTTSTGQRTPFRINNQTHTYNTQ
jgi:hypothetical protein